MTKEELEQLISLRAEIEEIKAEIKAIREKPCDIVSDKVQASSKEFPYTQGNKVIRGYDTKAMRKKNAKIRDKTMMLEARMKEAEALEIRITAFINNIHNSELRRIFHLRYEKGLTWEQVGRSMHCDRTTAEKRISKYLREHPEE